LSSSGPYDFGARTIRAILGRPSLRATAAAAARRASEWLERACAHHGPGVTCATIDRFPSPLCGDARRLPFLRRMRLAQVERTTREFPGARPPAYHSRAFFEGAPFQYV
jgi:hypothetical protein